ncbi:streptogrisin C [Streptomyces griseochromogenes]|nr:S1 family peptidase [Streptomyces griseochromogenes]MBP2055128.1 streptogrisin C [Streptomyces griseochromogenes]
MQRDLGISAEAARTRFSDEATAVRTSKAVRAELGGRIAGSWIDTGTGHLVVAVTDSATEKRARRLGARTRRVKHGAAELAAAYRTVSSRIGTGRSGVHRWGVDAQHNRVVVELARTASAPSLKGLPKGIVRIERTDDVPQQQGGAIRGGETWSPYNESPCSIGFAVTGPSGEKGFLTAGHCTNDVDQGAYGSDGSWVGTSNKGGSRSVDSSEGDFGLVTVESSAWSLTSQVSAYQYGAATVTGSAEGMAGQTVCRSGQTTGWRCGTITSVDQSVNYGNVVVDGLSYTNACSDGGDSGGAYVTWTGSKWKAVGLHSGGGVVHCGQTGSPYTMFQPVNEALGKWGLTLVTG